MKTLQEYILEAMSQEDFLKKIHDIYNDDYESAHNVLTNYNKLIQSIENYGTNNQNTDDVLSLITLFDERGLPLNKRNKLIIKNVYKEFKIDTINDFVDYCTTQKPNNIFKNEEEILRNKELFNFKDEKSKKLNDLVDYLIDIEYFSKSKNSAKSGKFELLFILMFGKAKDVNDKNEDSLGDLHLSNGEKIEIKAIRSEKNQTSKATLGANVGKNSSIKDLSETFLQSIFPDDKDLIIKIFKGEIERQHTDRIESFCKEKANKQSFKKPQANRCLGNESANINIMSILNTFLSKKEKNPTKELCEIIFKSYINVLLGQYGQEDIDDNVFKNITNPFEIIDNFIYCKKLTQITGAIHLYGYALAQDFNHILICDQSTSECICIKNVNKVGTIETVLKNITFDPAEVNSDNSARKNNVSKIKDFKRS